MAEIGAMWFITIRVPFVAVVACAVGVATVATDDWFDMVRLPAAATLLTVLLVVRLDVNNTTTTIRRSITYEEIKLSFK